MRKIIFIILIVIVAVIVGVLTWREFQIPTINHVADYTTSEAETHIKVSRLYAAQVNIEAYEKALEEIMKMTEYTDEQRLAAAIASGSPAFIPTFNIGVNQTEDGVQILGFVSVEAALNQREHRFDLGKVSLEAEITGGNLEIDDVAVTQFAESETPLTKIFSETQAAFDITGASQFDIEMIGDSGTVTLQFVYSISAATPLPKIVMTERAVQIHVTIELVADGVIGVEFDVEPYSTLEEIYEAE
jgi:uncharacterized protein YxeA